MAYAAPAGAGVPPTGFAEAALTTGAAAGVFGFAVELPPSADNFAITQLQIPPA